MNILIFRFPFESSMGGTEKHTLNLVEKLSARGLNFFLASSCPILLTEFKKRQWPAHKLYAGKDPVSRNSLILFPLWAPFFVIQIFFVLLYYRLFKKCQRLYCLTLTEKILATPLAKLFGYKIFWTEHTLVDNWLTQSPMRFPYQWLSKYAKIVTVSYAIKKQLLEFGVDSERVVVIHNSINVALFSQAQTPSTQPKRAFTIGTACRLSPEKGIPVLLQAAKIIQDVIPALRVIIIGDGPEKTSLAWLSKNLGLDQRVQFVGWQENVGKWLINLDIFILPSVRREAFGQVLLEAMALGKAVVASRIGGIPEVVEQNKTGLLIEAGNHEMLAQAVINLHNQPDWIKQLGQNGYKRVIENFDEEKMLGKYFDLLG